MIDPDYLNEAIKGTQNAVSELNMILVRQIAERIDKMFRQGNLKMYSPTAIADMYKVAQSGYSIDEVQALIEKELPSIKKEIRKAFLDSASEIAKYNEHYTSMIGESVGVDVPLFDGRAVDKMTINEKAILENAYRRTNTEVKNLTRTTALKVYEEYIKGCDTAFLKVRSGMSLDKAIAQTVDELAKQGIKTIQFKSGRTDDIDVAVARAVRTGINQANSEIVLERCASMGVGYVKVSQHMGARVTDRDDYSNHSWWQGKIYKLDWNKAPLNKYGKVDVQEPSYSFLDKIKKKLFKIDVHDYPDFVETCGYGKINGIVGINCRHTFQMWQPGINKVTEEPIDKEANEKRYRLEQKQRAMERSMRVTNRRIEALKKIEQTEDTKEKLTVLKRILKKLGNEYMAFCAENRLSPNYSRTR